MIGLHAKTSVELFASRRHISQSSECDNSCYLRRMYNYKFSTAMYYLTIQL